MSTADARARDLGAHRRRRHARRCARTGRRRLVADAFERMRLADGFSHARSLAFMSTSCWCRRPSPSSAWPPRSATASRPMSSSARSTTPCPVRRATSLTGAVDQARTAGASQAVPRPGARLGRRPRRAARPAMGQLERGLNRLYGVEQDRPTLQKYGRAFLLALTRRRASARWRSWRSAFGRDVGEALDNDSVSSALERRCAGRSPSALLVAMVALLFRWSPRRHQPAWSWLAFGSRCRSACCGRSSRSASGLMFRVSTSFGDTYGPLAGIVALLLWALLSAIGLFSAPRSRPSSRPCGRVPGPQRERSSGPTTPARRTTSGWRSSGSRSWCRSSG